jgi:pimeloyl-ACP methyl ester carboxylesterase
LSENDLAEFAARAVPHPAAAAAGGQRLSNEARRHVPTTIIACSLPSATIAELAKSRHPMFVEVTELTDLTYVDLPTGHWPMWSRPADLAAALMAAAAQEPKAAA